MTVAIIIRENREKLKLGKRKKNIQDISWYGCNFKEDVEN